jgi:hypothetical protein
MLYLFIRVVSFVSYITLLVRLHLYYGPHLSLNVYIYSFIKLALLAVYTIMISHLIYDLGCVSLNLHI